MAWMNRAKTISNWFNAYGETLEDYRSFEIQGEILWLEIQEYRDLSVQFESVEGLEQSTQEVRAELRDAASLLDKIEKRKAALSLSK